MSELTLTIRARFPKEADPAGKMQEVKAAFADAGTAHFCLNHVRKKGASIEVSVLLEDEGHEGTVLRVLDDLGMQSARVSLDLSTSGLVDSYGYAKGKRRIVEPSWDDFSTMCLDKHIRLAHKDSPDFDANVRNALGARAVHLAAKAGYLKWARFLIGKGAELNVDGHDPWGFGIDPLEASTPLGLAVRAGHAEMVEALLQAGADPHQVDRRGLKAIDYAQRESVRARLRRAMEVQSGS